MQPSSSTLPSTRRSVARKAGASRGLSQAFTTTIVRPLKSAMERIIRRHAPLGDATFFDPATFPWVRDLEEGFAVIRGELDRVLLEPESIPDFRDLSPGQSAIVDGAGWKSFFLYLTGRRTEAGCLRCPETVAFLEKIPGLESAFFSVLEPGTHLRPHHGPYGGLLRYHLGLVVPAEARLCQLRVGAHVAHWREGGSLVFDDSHEHEAWNRSGERRVVLFVDFARPLPGPLAVINRWVLRLIARAAFIEELRTNLAGA
jgi:aspartyl/asparaginyl beta-hydroxylase (cupin superfamily)